MRNHQTRVNQGTRRASKNNGKTWAEEQGEQRGMCPTRRGYKQRPYVGVSESDTVSVRAGRRRGARETCGGGRGRRAAAGEMRYSAGAERGVAGRGGVLAGGGVLLGGRGHSMEEVARRAGW